ncbi:MAG: cytochrome c nitrite reductase small subunit [Ignavibacteria bacterium]|nr:cytochrome c nitrite reductase small subunit [Ignavibacteria bacterium]
MRESFNKLIQNFIPPSQWRFPVAVASAIFIGLGLFVIYISNAPSYLSDKPEACINCHVMTSEYVSWRNGSHGKFAVCNDCHVPHDNFIRKYYFKASDGLRHSFIFTFRLEPQVIQMKEAGKNVVQENCIRCHSNLLTMVTAKNVSGANYKHGEGKLCWECHRETPHGRVHSLASAPYARVPDVGAKIPKWIMELTDSKK